MSTEASPAPVPANVSDLMAGVTLNAIVFDRRGHQLRTVITGGKTHPTFVYPSKRYRRAQRGEGATEFLHHQLHEVKAGSLDFLPQPCRIEATISGREVRAIPDFASVAIGERPVLTEAKRDWSEFDKPRAMVQQALTRMAAEALDWDYDQVTLASAGTDDFVANVEEVQAHRFAHVPIRQETAALRALSAGSELTMDAMIDAIDETPGRGRGLICALMVRRILEIDLSTPISDRSIVRAAPKRPFAWPSIRL